MVAARGALRYVGWCLALAAVLVVLHRLSAPVGDLGALDLRSREPADLLPVLLAGARWIALACAWYLAGATALSTLSAVVSWRPLRELDRALTVPAVRRIVRTGLGASLALGLSVGPTAVAAAATGAPGPPGASGSPAPIAQLDDRPTGGPATSSRGSVGVTSATPVEDVPVRADATSSAEVVDDVVVDRPDHGDERVPPPVVAPPASPNDPRPAPPRQAGVPPGAGSGPTTSPADEPAARDGRTSPDATTAPDAPDGSAAPDERTGSDERPETSGRDGVDGPDAAGSRTPARTGVTEGSADRAPHRPAGPPGAGASPPATPPPGAAAPEARAGSSGDDRAVGASREADGRESGDAADDARSGDVHVVVTGESFWSIAEDLTAEELGREPDDAEILERWLALIERNRDLLLVPDDPDLLLPGQELRLTEEGR